MFVQETSKKVSFPLHCYYGRPTQKNANFALFHSSHQTESVGTVTYFNIRQRAHTFSSGRCSRKLITSLIFSSSSLGLFENRPQAKWHLRYLPDFIFPLCTRTACSPAKTLGYMASKAFAGLDFFLGYKDRIKSGKDLKIQARKVAARLQMHLVKHKRQKEATTLPHALYTKKKKMYSKVNLPYDTVP